MRLDILKKKQMNKGGQGGVKVEIIGLPENMMSQQEDSVNSNVVINNYQS
jgi:hypothetical protein